MQKITVKSVFTDQRGDILDLLEKENINAVTIITFNKKGDVRGNHYHEQTYQWNYIMNGAMKLVTQLPDGEIQEVILNKGDFAVTVPHEKHALVGMVDGTEVLVLTKGPRGGSDYENDTFRLKDPLVTASK